MGHVTYPIPGTLWILEMGRAGKKKSTTTKFEICSIEMENLVAVQISRILRGFVWEKVTGGQGLPIVARDLLTLPRTETCNKHSSRMQCVLYCISAGYLHIWPRKSGCPWFFQWLCLAFPFLFSECKFAYRACRYEHGRVNTDWYFVLLSSRAG